MADPLRLVLMTFPQHFDGDETLTLNVLLVPAVDPLPLPLIGATAPSFATGAPHFEVIVDAGLAAEPAPPGTFTLTPTILSAPAAPAETFALLQSAVTGNGATLGTPPALTIPRIRKPLPASYLAAGGAPPDGNFTTTEDEFGCAVRGAAVTPIGAAPPKTVTWGQVISYALRQPILATKLGLLYRLSVTLPAKDSLAHGGYVYVQLATSDPWAEAAALPANAGSLRVHAARIPALGSSPRALFAAIAFPLQTVPPEGPAPSDADVAIAEAYSDGFAKIVHCSQPQNVAAAVGDGTLPPASDLGIELGWDDTQVVTWHNDQLQLQAARAGGTLNAAPFAPLGVLGYRVDAADVTPEAPGGSFLAPAWQSLCRITTALPSSLGSYTGDLTIEPVAAQPYSTTGADAWLPRYFANWRGGSLCEPDPIPSALTTGSAPVTSTRVAADLTYLLSYGHTYSFRVRFGDLSSGGPLVADAPIDPEPGSVASQTFQRLVPPKAPSITQVDANGNTIVAQPGIPTAPASLVVKRPLIVYPEVLYTHLGDEAAWRDTIRATLVAAATAAVAEVKSTSGRSGAAEARAVAAGLPDPDVSAISIDVSVRHPLHDAGTDAGTFVTLYSTSRVLDAATGSAPLFEDPGTTIAVVFVDEPSIVTWSPTGQPTTGPLLIPRGRDVRITVRALLRDDPLPYYGAQASASMASTVLVRVEPSNEPLLLGRSGASEPVAGYLFRRPVGFPAPPLVTQLATELGVVANGNALSSPPGTRVVFGASGALRTLLSADAETLTFGSESELVRFWIVAVVLDLERDWTWDGLANGALTVSRGGPTDTESTAVAVGSIAIPRVVGSAATTSPSSLSRSQTRLIFFDAIDPHEPTGTFPQALQHRWFVRPLPVPAGPALSPDAPTPVYVEPPPSLTGTEFANAPLDLMLPIAIPPTQVPAIASVGLALSPYEAGPRYASTSARRRALWIELTEPIENVAGDALFARVLAHGADPLLYSATPQASPDVNPPLPLDPELVRAVIPGDTDDRAGSNAMMQLAPASDSDVHFLLPLPPGVAPDSSELFGFYTYELRIGHAGALGDLQWWSTANGRFGSPLRVVGVQHPAPALVVQSGRIVVPDASAAAVLAAMESAESPFRVQNVLAPFAPSSTPAVGTPSLIVATAPFAAPTLDGTPLLGTVERPHTTMWFMLYAQATQADGTSIRNVLIALETGVLVARTLDLMPAALLPYFVTAIENALKPSQVRTAIAAFHQAQVEAILASVHLPLDSPLSVLAVELLPGGTGTDVGRAAGGPTLLDASASATAVAAPPAVTAFPFGRILRTSPLVPIAAFC